MFTGIIEAKTRVLSFKNNLLRIERPQAFTELKIGQSIATNGVCLTVIDFDEQKIAFDVMPETIRRTNLSEAEVINLERALPASGRFEGHVVQGHVDGVLTLLERKQEGDWQIFVLEKPIEYANLLVEKGSVALNGISLTIASVDKQIFSVALIPHTLENTNFNEAKIGEKINFECDILAKLLLEAQKNAK